MNESTKHEYTYNNQVPTKEFLEEGVPKIIGKIVNGIEKETLRRVHSCHFQCNIFSATIQFVHE